MATASEHLDAHSGRISTKVPTLNLRWLRSTQGPEVAHNVIQDVQEATGTDLETDLRGRWVPYAVHAAFLESLKTRLDEEELRAMGAYGAEHLDLAIPGLDGILRFVGPRRILKQAHRIWSQYADFGAVRVPEARSRRGRLVLEDLPASTAFCSSLQGFFEGLIARLGGSDVHVRHDGCTAQGHDACTFVGTWS